MTKIKMSDEEILKEAIMTAMDEGASIRSEKLAQLFDLKDMPEAAIIVRAFDLFSKQKDT